MKVFILVILLIPIFAFYVFVNLNTINSIKIPTRNASADTNTTITDARKTSRRTNLKVIK